MSAIPQEIRKLEDARHRAARNKSGQQSVPVANNRVCSAADLMAREFPEPRWAVPNLIPEGVTGLAGPPKVGKTWFGLDIALGVASGGHVLGKIPVEKRRVLYIGLEDGPKRFQKRLQVMLGDGEVSSNLSLAFTWRRFDEGGIEDTDDYMKREPDTGLIVFDTLKKVRPIEHVRGRLFDGDYDAVGPMGDIAKSNGVAVLLITHTRKMFSPDPLDLVSGSLGLTAAMDGILVLKRARGQADAVLHAMGRDIEDQELALRWDKETIGWTMLGDASQFRLSNERQEVLAMLRTESTVTPKVASELLGRPPGAVRKLLWSMQRDGELHADGRGRYSLPHALIEVSQTNDLYIPPGASDAEIEEICT